MSEDTALDTTLDNIEEFQDEDRENGEIISLRTAKLLKLKQQIKQLKKEALTGYAKEMKECKSAFKEINALIGELNDATGGKPDIKK